MNIETVKHQYRDQWVLLEVLKEDELNQPLEVNVLAHSQSREDVYDALLKAKEDMRVAIIFTGELLKEGYAAAFFTL